MLCFKFRVFPFLISWDFFTTHSRWVEMSRDVVKCNTRTRYVVVLMLLCSCRVIFDADWLFDDGRVCFASSNHHDFRHFTVIHRDSTYALSTFVTFTNTTTVLAHPHFKYDTSSFLCRTPPVLLVRPSRKYSLRFIPSNSTNLWSSTLNLPQFRNPFLRSPPLKTAECWLIYWFRAADPNGACSRIVLLLTPLFFGHSHMAP